MKRILCVAICLVAAAVAAWGQQRVSGEDIVILYDNDVHGAVEGYARMAAMKKMMANQTGNVVTVSCGDFLSGSSYGSLSRGAYLIRLMNSVGYDFVTLGNHEFDFGIPTLTEQLGNLSAKTVCCNFSSVEGDDLYPGYSLCRVGGKLIAFVGVTTPTVPTSSTPIFFTDSVGHWKYSFHGDHLDSVIQSNVDKSRREGADYVIVLSHLGESDVPQLVARLRGIDAVIDGHSHTTIADSTLYDKQHKPVLWTQTGAYFEHVGQLVVYADGRMSSTLIARSEIPEIVTPTVDTLLSVQREYEAIGSRWVAHSAVNLGRKDYARGWADCTLGNFFADAFRVVAKAQIGLMNAGGMRVDIPAGEVTFHHLFSAAPFDNRLIKVEVSGQSIMDALEFGCYRYPKVGGGFLQVSGLTYDIDTTVHGHSGECFVEINEQGIFQKVIGRRRVVNVCVWDSEKRCFEPIVPEKLYTVAGCDYTLLKHGDGHNFGDVKVLEGDSIPYVDALELYIREHLHGSIGPYYALPKKHIRLGVGNK